MYKYHKEHAWVKIENDTALIGLSFYAQAHLGRIVYVDIPQAGQQLEAGLALGGIESEKTTSEVVSPISGEVIESNDALESTPELINNFPLTDGWITRVRLDDGVSGGDLMEAKEYETYLSGIKSEEEAD